MNPTLQQATGEGPVALLEYRGHDDTEFSFPAEGNKPARTGKKRLLSMEFAGTGKQVHVVQWSDRKTGELPEIKTWKKGQKLLVILSSFARVKDVLTAGIDRVLEVQPA